MVNVVNSALAKVQLSSQSISVYQSDALGNNLGTWTNAQAGQYVCVQISGTYKVSLPAFLHLPASMPMTFRAVRLSEGN